MHFKFKDFEFTEDQLAKMKEYFVDFDLEQTGFLCKKAIKFYIKFSGTTLSNKQFKQLVKFKLVYQKKN